MKRILCFVYDGFADFETVLVCSGLNGCENLEIIYISYDTLPLKSSGGLTIFPEKSVSEISRTDEIDGLLIPGGSERELKPELKELIKQLNEENKLIAAICAGPEFLAKAGILNGVKYTTSQTAEVYKEQGESDPFPRGTYVEERIVQDGNILTAQGHAFIDFALKVWDWYDVYDYDGEREELREQFTNVESREIIN
ncbi:MAG: DJ-1/PfpI family protein [Promethearchaeota archaeon]|jgi:putative intracellular protease/amidase